MNDIAKFLREPPVNGGRTMSERTDLYRKDTFDLVDEILELRQQRDDLLETCKMLKKFLDESWGWMDGVDEEYTQLCSAIARAEGQSE